MLTDNEVYELARQGFEVLGIVPDPDTWYLHGKQRQARACMVGSACYVASDGQDAHDYKTLLGKSWEWFMGVSDGFAGRSSVIPYGIIVDIPDYSDGFTLGQRGRSAWIHETTSPSDLVERQSKVRHQNEAGQYEFLGMLLPRLPVSI